MKYAAELAALRAQVAQLLQAIDKLEARMRADIRWDDIPGIWDDWPGVFGDPD